MPPGFLYLKYNSMKKNKNKLLLLAVLFPILALAQSDINTEKKNTFTTNLSYQTALHFFGRTDNLQSSGISSVVGFELKNGLYNNNNFIFVQNSATTTSYAGGTLEVGYRFGNNEAVSGNIFYSHFLYNNNSELVQSILKSQTGVNLTFNNNVVNVNIGGDLKFSDKTDLGLTAGLDHLFIIPIKSKKALAINPSIYGYAGTQNFSTTYINTIKPILPILPSQTQQQTHKKTTLNILAYELSAPVVFVNGKFNFSITPSYVLPQNLMEGEVGKNLFYTTLSVGVRL